MGTADIVPIRWRDVPQDKVALWRAIFSASSEGTNVTATCPICGTASLHRYFHLHRAKPTVEGGRKWAGSGSQWQWCSSCLSYEHSSGLVPEWWTQEFDVPESDLMHDPGPIEAAMQRSRHRDRS